MTKQSEGKIEKEKLELPSGITQEQIDQWKEKYGADNIRLKSLFTDGSLEPFLVVTRVPNRTITNEYIKWVDKDFNKATLTLVANCCLHSVDQIKKNDELFYSAGKAIVEDLPIGRIESKKL